MMHPSVFRRAAVGIAFASIVAATPVERAVSIDPHLFAGLTWRNIGPFRGGRISAVSGAIGQPGVFYAGLPAGGVWKTTSAGQTWFPVMDDVKEASSVGAVEVAPSDPNVIYAGMGDLITGGGVNEGNGVYKSTDAGKTWRHMGLDATKQIPSLLVDPRDPNTVLVAAQGDVHVKSDSRGVFRSTDGGTSWTRTLAVEDSTGIQKLARANDVPNVVFATTVRHFTAIPGVPPRPATPPDTTIRPQTRVYRSADGGVTWREMAGAGVPRIAGRTSIAVAMHTNGARVFLVTNSGLYRSDDGGANWRQMAKDDSRIRNGQGGYNCGVYVSPDNPDVVYTLSTSSYKSVDGGNTFTGFKGAPGGDDPQQLWIDPTNGDRMLMGLDQGAVVTLDGGANWSSWYIQSTEQIYHLNIDNSFPYWVYGTQQDAGAIRTRARGNLGAITMFDWNTISGWEWGTILPDPLDVNTIYSSGSGILKISNPGETWINVSPAADPAMKLRTTISQPIAFAPWNKHMLVAAFQSVMATTDGGAHWKALSGDLCARSDTLTAPAAPGSGAAPACAIESMSLSPVAAGMIWVGSNNGRIRVTRNAGTTWDDASIPGLPFPARAEVLAVEASNFDPATAYAAVDLHRIGDYAPYLFRTHDYGKTWTKIVTDLPVNQANGSFARVIRNDTKKAGLLFAGTESGVFVSFDDGDHWQSLMQNLPNTSYRDMRIKDNDLIVATYGRGFWVLDDFSMLRQISSATATEPAHLFKPGDAYRLRRNVGADTPLPPEVPHALNPADGVIIDYWLAQAPGSDITLDVLDASGASVRHLSSAPMPPVNEAARPPNPNFWLAAPAPLPKRAGTNRTNWDLRYDEPLALSHSFEINANPGRTPASPEGPLALPGVYTLKLMVDGRTYSQAVTVRGDPRSPATPAALGAQHAFQMQLVDGLRSSFEGRRLALALRDALRGAVPAGAQPELGDLATRAAALSAQLDTVAGLDATRGARTQTGVPIPSFSGLNNTLASRLNAQDLGDLAPTPAVLSAYRATCKDLATLLIAWQRISTTELGGFNTALTARGRAALALPASALKPPSCM